MRFAIGNDWHLRRGTRGPGRHRYRMSDSARDQRKFALKAARGGIARPRCYDETLTIKLLIWQWRLETPPKPSLRALARELGVSHPYVHHVAKRSAESGKELLALHKRRITFDDLAADRRHTNHLRELNPYLFAPPTRRQQLIAEQERRAEAANAPPWIPPEEYAAQVAESRAAELLERLRQRREREAATGKPWAWE